MVALNYEVKHIRRNQYSRSGDKLLRLQAIVVHYTANPGGDADMHYRYFNTLNGRYAGAHIFVDRNKALELMPLDEVAYHANERKAGPLWSALKATAPYYPGGNANLLTVGIEMCLEPDGSFHPDTIERTRQVVKMLQAKFPHLADTQNRVVRHYDITGKSCPKPFVESPAAWAKFLKSIDEPVMSTAKKEPAVSSAAQRKLAETQRRKKQMAENKKATGFTDVAEGQYYSEAVKWLKEQGILAGYTDGSFGVGKDLKREEFAVALYRALTK